MSQRALAGVLGAASLAVWGGQADPFGELGENDFRISFVEGTGDPAFPAFTAAVAFNPTDDEYLVVWSAQSDGAGCAGTVDDVQILVRRIDGRTGAFLGDTFDVSFRDTNCPRLRTRAFDPAVAYNATDNEYLVVWSADHRIDGVIEDENEIFGRRVPGGIDAVIGFRPFRISDMGGTGNISFDAVVPAVAWNAVENQYLVVWRGDHNEGGLVDNENEIFGQRLDKDGTAQGANDFRISEMGGTGDDAFDAIFPAVVWNATEDEYLVVWRGDHNEGGLVDNEFEIFGQRLNENGTDQGTNDFRISEMGGTGNDAFDAFSPAVVWNATDNEYLVVWVGDHDDGGLVDGELEIFGQRLNENGAAQGANDFRISDAGGTGNPSINALVPAVAWISAENEYLVVWEGRDDVSGLSPFESEIFGQRLDALGGDVGNNDFRISDMGGTGDNPFGASRPAVACVADRSECLTVWEGDDDIGGQVAEEFEIFGQRLGVPQTIIFIDSFEGHMKSPARRLHSSQRSGEAVGSE